MAKRIAKGPNQEDLEPVGAAIDAVREKLQALRGKPGALTFLQKIEVDVKLKVLKGLRDGCKKLCDPDWFIPKPEKTLKRRMR